MADRNQKSRCASCWEWIGSPTFYLYLNFFLGAWGDRMWMFSVGLYLVTLAEGVLRLAAVYSLSGSCCFLLFGGILGDWVDRNGRLKVVRITLVIQNLCVMLSAVAVALALSFTEEIYSSTALKVVTEASIIVFAVLAQLASMTYHIAIEKDWVVTVATGDNSSLANMNAVIRSLDLSCKILAPTVCGFIMHYGSLFISALVIVGWNIVSVFIEYGLLTKVYRMVPDLAVKGGNKDEKKEDLEGNVDEKEPIKKNEENCEENPNEDTKLTGECERNGQITEKSDECGEKKVRKSCGELMVEPFVTMVRSWKIYSKQSVAFAGLSLSFLYMTVLGFDSITVGFIYYNGVSESVTGLSMALAGLFGIFGTILYTRFRKCLGLEKTGLFSFSFEIICLVLCVISIFVPGSKFNPTFNPWGNTSVTCTQLGDPTVLPDVSLNTSYPGNDTHTIVKRDIQGMMVNDEERLHLIEEPNIAWSLSTLYPADQSNGFPNFAYFNEGGLFTQESNGGNAISFLNAPVFSDAILGSNHVVKKRDAPLERMQRLKRSTPNDPCKAPRKYDGFNYSVVLLLVGIVTSRIGLWMSDLVITQTLQENVAEKERGTVNGIQGSLNMLMDILKNVLVILVPHIQSFGYLIMLSFLFICAAGCLFCVHFFRFKGHLFRDKRFWCCCCCGQNQNKAIAEAENNLEEPARILEDMERDIV